MKERVEGRTGESPAGRYLTVILRNERSSPVPVGGEPLLLRAFVEGEEWETAILSLARALHQRGGVSVRFMGEGVDPDGIDLDDPDEAAEARSAVVVACFEGDRLTDLRAAVAEFLHTSGIPSCSFLHSSGPTVEVVHSGDHTVIDLAALMRAEGCQSPEDLVDHIDSQAKRTASVDWAQSNEKQLRVCIGDESAAFEYPFTMEQFWSTVIELDERT